MEALVYFWSHSCSELQTFKTTKVSLRARQFNWGQLSDWPLIKLPFNNTTYSTSKSEAKLIPGEVKLKIKHPSEIKRLLISAIRNH
jgi:predicted transcriptional regulator